MDACGLRLRPPGPPISHPKRPIRDQSQSYAQTHFLDYARTIIASGLPAGRSFPTFNSVASPSSLGQGLDFFWPRFSGNVGVLYPRKINRGHCPEQLVTLDATSVVDA